MNERIKELLEQAGFDVKRLLEPYPGGFPREDFLALESFAELIVRECVGVCNDARDSTDFVTIAGITDYCAKTIMNRFGVEE